MATDANLVIDFLAHHGVKGMKWGVRRDRGHEGERVKTKQLPKLDQKFVNSFNGGRGWVKIQNTFADHINPRLQVINSKPQYKDKNLLAPENKALYNRYLKEYEREFDAAAKATSASLGLNPSGSHQVNVRREGHGANSEWVASYDPVAQHADMAPQTGDVFTIIPTFNATGHIVAVKLKPYANAMGQAEVFVDEFLAHFGVKGMKWGVHRDHSAAVGRIQKDLPKASQAKADPTKKAYAKTTKSAGGLHKLSNEELQSMINRMEMEKKYSKAMNEEKERRLAGLKAVGRILGEVGKIALPIIGSVAVGVATKNYADTGSVFRAAATSRRVIEGTARAIGA